jgi:hypothetical protein
VEGSCEHGNEPSGSMKCWETLSELVVASQEGLSSMELVQMAVESNECRWVCPRRREEVTTNVHLESRLRMCGSSTQLVLFAPTR